MTSMPILPNPWIVENTDFPRGFDVEAFMAVVELAPPKFLADPSPEYLTAVEIETMLVPLAKY